MSCQLRAAVKTITPVTTYLIRTSVGQRVHVPALRGSGMPAMASTSDDLPLDWFPAVTRVGSCTL